MNKNRIERDYTPFDSAKAWRIESFDRRQACNQIAKLVHELRAMSEEEEAQLKLSRVCSKVALTARKPKLGKIVGNMSILMPPSQRS